DAEVFGIGGMITTYEYVKWLCQTIRNLHAGALIVAGGSAASSIPMTFLSNTQADVVVVGEGEETLLDVLDYAPEREFSHIPGIWYRKQDRVIQNFARDPIRNLDSIPLPAWHLFPMDIYLDNPIGAYNQQKWLDGGGPAPKSMNVLSSRGCPYNCIYCYHDFMGEKYRARSANNVFEEVKYLNDYYGVAYVHFVDDNFMVNRSRVEAFCQLLMLNGIHVEWGCTARVDLVEDSLLDLMARAGCIEVGLGIESGSQKMLDIMKKRVTVEQAKKALAIARKHIKVVGTAYIIGLPGETRETVEETIRFVEDAGVPPEVIFFATPYPGTELYRIARAKGMIADEETFVLSLWEQGEKIAANFTDMADDELFALREEMISRTGAKNVVRHEKNGSLMRKRGEIK
ncbi:MAG: radical SAM protein, partial [Candidatus Aenigmatarchaeota archaeon]